jgi:hypothetical protein
VSLADKTYHVGDTLDIQWDRDKARISEVVVELSADGGMNYLTVSEQAMTEEHLAWPVPEQHNGVTVSGSSAIIKVEDYDKEYPAVTTGPIAILPRQTVAVVRVIPAGVTLKPGETFQFQAFAVDRNGTRLTRQPSFTWEASGGTIDPATGAFTAPDEVKQSVTIEAVAGGTAVAGFAGVVTNQRAYRYLRFIVTEAEVSGSTAWRLQELTWITSSIARRYPGEARFSSQRVCSPRSRARLDALFSGLRDGTRSLSFFDEGSRRCR